MFFCISSSSKSDNHFLFNMLCLWSANLCSVTLNKDSHVVPYGMHSLPVFISPIVTSVVALHYYSILFLRPFSSFCTPISSSLMTTRPILLTNGLPARWENFTWSSSLIHVIVEFSFDILTLIRGLVIFRLHFHQCFYWDTISMWLPTKAEEHLTYPREIPCQMPARIFQGHRDILIIIGFYFLILDISKPKGEISMCFLWPDLAWNLCKPLKLQQWT